MPGGRGPKARGDGYEREIAAYWNGLMPHDVRCGAEARRVVMSGGGNSDGGFDLGGVRVSVSGVDWELGIEAKRVERLNLWEAADQADKHREKMRARGVDVSRLLPAVVARRNRMATGDSLVVMRLDDLARLLSGDRAVDAVDAVDAASGANGARGVSG